MATVVPGLTIGVGLRNAIVLDCWKAKSRENSDVSPVVRFVAVAVTRLPNAREPATVAVNVVMPLASVSRREPSKVLPWPWPEADAVGVE